MTTREIRMRDNIDRTANDAAARENLREPGEARNAAEASRGPPGIDPVTGEVTGAGSGAGGGNPGEDYDDDHTAGSNSAS